MEFFTKSERNNITRFKIFGMSIFRINYGEFFKIYKFLGIRIKQFNYTDHQRLELGHLVNVCRASRVKLFFDIALGGGTESYFYSQVDKYGQEFSIVRIQYRQDLKLYQITLFKDGQKQILVVKKLTELEKLLVTLRLDEIIVNDLVSYPDALGILRIIKKMKGKSTTVSARGHDFQSVCLFYTLISKGKFCGGPSKGNCRVCFSQNAYDGKRDKKLLSGITDINIWRAGWMEFYQDVVYEMIVFSGSSYDVFLQTYPCLQDKMKIIPHEVHYLRPAKQQKSTTINIGVLGAIGSIAKGKLIIRELEHLIEREYAKDVKLTIIGDYQAASNKTKVIGRYKRDELPYIVESNKISIIFIPSVWPETFSYTTSEAMLLGIPVACFDLGAQAERVSKYEKGLVIQDIDAKQAVNNICGFVNGRR